MGQKIAKRELEKGERFFMDQRFDEAVELWTKALKHLKKPLDKFRLCGKICETLCEVGKYRDALAFAGQQCEIANQLNDVTLKSEAYFHLALCNEKSCEFSKAIAYSRCAQQVNPETSTLTGHIHLCLASAFSGTSEFVKAWKSFKLALDEAKTRNDRELELLTLSKIGALFTSLGDYETALCHCSAAMDITERLGEDDAGSRFRRRLAVHIATAYRKMGRYSESMDHCEDAMKAAMMYGDRPVQARCLFLFADIHRKRNDLERASPRYESAYSIMSETGDRIGQVEALGGMAKTAACLRDYNKSIELNEKALEMSTKIGSKLEMLRCHARLLVLRDVTDDIVASHRHSGVIKQLVQEMDLYCGVCDDVIGQTPEKLEPLECGHFIHARCSVHLARSTLGRAGKKRPCPACRRQTSLNPAVTP